MDIPLSRIHLRPEFRYSHWFAQTSVGNPTGAAAVNSISPILLTAPVPFISSFPINQNEASFLLGVTF